MVIFLFWFFLNHKDEQNEDCQLINLTERSAIPIIQGMLSHDLTDLYDRDMILYRFICEHIAACIDQKNEVTKLCLNSLKTMKTTWTC